MWVLLRHSLKLYIEIHSYEFIYGMYVVTHKVIQGYPDVQIDI